MGNRCVHLWCASSVASQSLSLRDIEWSTGNDVNHVLNSQHLKDSSTHSLENGQWPLNLGWPLTRGKKNRGTLIGTPPNSLIGGGCSIDGSTVEVSELFCH